MKRKNKVLAFLITTVFAITQSIIVYADEFVGYNAIHGDPTIENNEVMVLGPSDVARYYPNDSYHSVNRQACTCHTSNHNPSLSCNCGRYYYYVNGYNNSNGSGICYQCAAFAKFCYHEYNDLDVFHKPDDETNDIYINLTTSNLYGYLQQIGNNAYIRGKTSEGRIHSIFLVGFTNNTVTIWHSNYTGACKVENATLSYNDFLDRMKRINWYYTSGGDYFDL